MHQWQSSTLKFVEMIDLNQPVIKLGPWTLLTIDQGYTAVTQDNGKQIMLEGGSVAVFVQPSGEINLISVAPAATPDEHL